MASTAPSPQNTSGFLPLIRWFATFHAQPFAEQAFLNALPAAFDQADPDNLSRMFDAVGLKSTWVDDRLKHLDPAVLPVVICDTSGAHHILVGLDPKAGRAAVITPQAEGDGALTELPLPELEQRYRRGQMLVSPHSEKVLSRLHPDTAARAAGRHWLWGTLAQNRSAWVQVALAALGMNLMGLALPIFVMNVYDRVIPNLAFVTLTTLAIGVMLALVLDQVLRALRTQVIEGMARRVDLQVASDLFRRALNLRILTRPGGASAMISNIRDFETIREFFGSATLVSLIDLMFIGIFLAALSVVVGPLTWVPVIGTVAILIVALMAQRPIARSVDTAQNMAVKRHTVLVESLLGVETIKSLNAEPVMLREWEQAVAASARVNARTRIWSTFTTSATLFIQQSVSVGLIVWGVFLVSEGEITIGALIAANILAGRIMSPLSQIAQTIFRTQYALRSVRTINEMMTAPVEGREGLRSDLAVRRGEVELRGVSFTYPGSPEPALRDLSFTVEPGECVALLGRVGSGKTTIGKMLNGLIAPTEGLVLIDGHAAGQYEPSMLRDGVGYLSQDPELFTGTIRENLMIGRPEASDEELHSAIYLAGMDRFVAQSPEGLNHFVGEKGDRLSGGQRQAVALARLLLRKPRLLFLDEPTNELDNQTEQIVIGRLQELRAAGVTLILCTHRMSVAEVADRYIVIDTGRKVMDGPRAAVLEALQRSVARAPAERE